MTEEDALAQGGRAGRETKVGRAQRAARGVALSVDGAGIGQRAEGLVPAGAFHHVVEACAPGEVTKDLSGLASVKKMDD